MKQAILLLAMIAWAFHSIGQNPQDTTPGKAKFAVGLGGPELLHAGINYRIANSSLLGMNVGIAPTMGGVWPSISLEHRFYLGKNNLRSNQRTWFFRQGISFTLPLMRRSNSH